MYDEIVVTFRVKSPEPKEPDLVCNIKFPLKMLKESGMPFSTVLNNYTEEFWRRAVLMGMLDI